MKLKDIKSIGCLVGDVIGSGIAQTIAQAGYKTIVREVSDELLAKARNEIVDGRWGLKGSVARGKLTQKQMGQILANISFTTKIDDLKNCDLIIEAIPEDMEPKRKVLAKLDELVRNDTIIASNSSYLTHAETSKGMEHKSRYIGMHWFNPPIIMKLVELIYIPDTSEEIIQVLEEFCQFLGKTSIRVKDVPGNTGYVANRVFAAAREEARNIADRRIATEEDVDTAMKLGYNWPVGPLGMARGIRSGWA